MVISLGLGLGSITVSAQLYSKYKEAFLKYFLIFIITLNIAAIFIIIFNYFNENLVEYILIVPHSKC